MNALELLRTQHQEALRLIGQIKAVERSRRRRLFERCADLLAMHFMLEEDHFYPGVHRPETEEGLLESVEEHLSARRLLADMLHSSTEDRRFLARLTVLEIELRHHITFEETDMFPRIETLVGRQRLEELGELMKEELKILQRDGDARALIPQQTAEAASV